MVKGWFTILEQWIYIASFLGLAIGGVILYRKAKSLPPLLMSVFLFCYLVGQGVVRVANSELMRVRQMEGPLEAAGSSWWLAVYGGHGIEFCSFAMACVAFLVFALSYKND